MLQRKRPCQTQAQNNGGQPWANRAICMQLFAVSRTTKANQRNLNGGWQASTNAFALCLCQPSPHCLPSKNGPVFFFLFKTDQTFLQFFPPTVWCPVEAWRVKGWSPLHYGELTRTDQLKMNLNVCYGLVLAAAQWRYLDTKPPLSFHFISWVLKATKCNSVDGFKRRYPSEPQWHFQFQGCW